LPNSLSDPRYRLIIERLRQARLEAGMTQAELAEELRVPQSFVAKVERLERRLDILEFVQIAEAIGISPGELI